MFKNVVDADYTRERYTGETARTYDQTRHTKQLWIDEIRTLDEFLKNTYVSLGGGTILDIPLGTGRFLDLYKKYPVKIIGIDVSEDMMKQAKAKDPSIDARIGDILDIDLKDKSVEVSVCIRLLNLIDEDEMIQALCELSRVTKYEIIISMRLGNIYEQVSERSVNHSEFVFKRMLQELGLRIKDSKQLQSSGYGLMVLGK